MRSSALLATITESNVSRFGVIIFKKNLCDVQYVTVYICIARGNQCHSPSCARAANIALKPHHVKQTRLVSYTLHFPRPQARKFWDLDLCLHFKSGQAWETLAEFGLPVLSRACRSLFGGTMVMTSTWSRGGWANAQILRLGWCSWPSCGTLRGWVTGRGDRLRDTRRDLGAV